MPSQKAQKIDLNNEYPCPCPRCRGQLVSIALMVAAMRCDRCNEMFEIQESGYILDQLPTSNPSKKSWCWTGRRWILARSTLEFTFLPKVVIILIAISLIVWLILLVRSLSDSIVIFWLAIVALLIGLTWMLLWLGSRR